MRSSISLSAIGGAEHHYPSQPLWAIFGEIGLVQPAALEWADEMGSSLSMPAAKPSMAGWNIFGQLFQRLPRLAYPRFSVSESTTLFRRLPILRNEPTSG